MKEVRCGRCQRLLAKAVFSVIEIKCPRCGVINMKAVEPQISAPQSADVVEVCSHGKTNYSLDGR